MNSYLVVYDRRSGHRDITEYPGPGGRTVALQERLRVERKHRRDHVEVVVITANSQDELRRTHSRYFGTVSELADAAGRRIGAGAS